MQFTKNGNTSNFELWQNMLGKKVKTIKYTQTNGNTE